MGQASSLSRREREIVQAVVRLGSASVADIRAELADPPSYSAVRTTVGILVEKGHLQFSKEGRKYLYRPTRSPSRLRREAVRDVVKDFFGGSAEQLVDALLDPSTRKLDHAELDRIADLVARARARQNRRRS